MKCDTFNFNINDKVNIIELKKHGRIKSIYITELGVKYQVRYFNNCDAKEVCFYADELILPKQPKKIGL